MQTPEMCEICFTSTTITRQWPCSDVFIVDFEQISHLCFFHCSLWTIQFRPSITTISNHPKLLKRIKFLIKIRKILNKTPMLRHVLVFGNQWFCVSIKGVIACEMLSRFRKRLVIWCGLPHLTFKHQLPKWSITFKQSVERATFPLHSR